MDALKHAVVAVVMIAAYRLKPDLVTFAAFAIAYWWWREAEQAQRSYGRWVMPWRWTRHRLGEALVPTAAALLAALI